MSYHGYLVKIMASAEVFNILFEYYHCLKVNYYIFKLEKIDNFTIFIAEIIFIRSEKQITTKT